MIRTFRPPNPAAVVTALTKPYPNDGLSEIARARKYYGAKPSPKKAYDFQRYKEREVCLALDETFHAKCAYCESGYAAVDSRDVEHFRPKGAVREAPQHPGYWWLAADWSNLLPSCPPCNQKRYQLSYDPAMTLEEFDKARLKEPEHTSGKGNSFPLLHSNWVVDETADVRSEDPLLINPCERDPNNHLEWVFSWNRSNHLWCAEDVAAFLRPRSKGGIDDPYGKASIAIFGLNRAGLFRERNAYIRHLQLHLQNVINATNDVLAPSMPPEKRTELRARIVHYRKQYMACFAAPNRNYAALAQAFLALFNVEYSQWLRAKAPSGSS